MNVDAATLAGGQRNQDAYGIFGNVVAVLDGASSYPATDPARDGGWYARTLLTALGQRLPDGGSLSDCLADAITATRDQANTSPGGASSTVLLARVDPHAVEVLVLGDSTLVIEQADGTLTTLCDMRLSEVAVDQRRAFRARFAAGVGFDAAHGRMLAQLQDAERAARNTEGGYWIAETDPNAAHHALTQTYPRDQVRGLLLLTDGAAVAVDQYASPPTWSEFLRQIDDEGAAMTVAAIHRLEQTDADGQRWPRSKCHDDKTLVRVRC